MFDVGQHVVCVNDDPNLFGQGPGTLNGLKAGIVYTVRDVFYDFHYDLGFVRLAEIIRPIDDTPYGIIRFRPVEPKRIQVFRSMLINPHKRVEVEA